MHSVAGRFHITHGCAIKFTIKSKPLRKGLVKHFDHLIKFKRDIDNILAWNLTIISWLFEWLT